MKKENILKTIAILLGLAALPVLFLFFDQKLAPTKRGVASVETTNDQVGGSNDLSELSPAEFKKAFKYQLLKKVSAENTTEDIGIRLGNLLLKGADGKPQGICQRYPTVEMTFAAEGVAVAGEVPLRSVRGPCVESEDGLSIEPVTIGISEFALTGSAQWNWVGTRFIGKNENDVLSLDGYEIIAVLGAPFIIESARK